MPKSKNEMKIFEQLKSEMAGWDIQSVADQSGVAKATIYFWLDGKTKHPRLDTVVKVAKAIGFDVQLVRTRAARLRLVA